jgi:outer membrane receptor protein involved in Fe transport
MIAYLRLLLCAVLLPSFYLLQAQDFSILGRVTEASDTPIEFANVVVLAEDSNQFIKGTSTDDNGRFSLNNLAAGNYKLRISYIGFEDYEQKLILNGNLDIKTIVLNEGAETLGQVDIVGRKPTITRKPDRLVFNIENTALTEGSTLGVLRNTPGVIVGEGEIKIKSIRAVVYINNRRVQLTSDELIQLLESAPANSIKSVEVITNPPASYDADSGAVINIIMSKNLVTGYRGSVATNYTQGVFPRYNAGTSHYFKNNKVNLNINYDYNSEKINRDNDERINYLDADNELDEIWRSNVNRNTWSETHNLNLNFDYYLDDKSTLSLTSTGLYMPYFKYKINNNTNISDSNGVFLSRFTANNLSRDNKYNIGSDLTFSHNFENAANLSFNAHYTAFSYERDQNVLSNFFDGSNSFINSSEFNTLANQETQIATAKGDYSLPINESSNFTTGLKYSNVITDSDITRIDIINEEEVINTDNSDAFKYDEKVFAAYANFSKSWENWDLNIGLRVEQTNIEGTSVTLNQTNTQDYLNWFPNLSLSHQLFEDMSIYGNYKRSIVRPNYTNLNPFRFFLNENFVVTGNPELTPTYIDHYTVGTSFLKYFTVEAYYMKYDGNIVELPRQDNTTNILAFSPTNLDNMVDYGFDFIVQYGPARWWYIYAVTSFYNISQETSFGNDFVSLDQWSNISILQNSFRFLEDNSLNINFNITYNNTNLQNLALISTRYISSLSVTKSVFNKKGMISLSIEDLFNEQDYLLDVDYLNQSSQYFTDIDNRFVKIGFRYNFGNTKLTTNERSTSAEERDRIKDLN